MKWNEYRGCLWTVEPGMCCPSIKVVTEQGNPLANVPYDGPNFEHKAGQIIDSYFAGLEGEGQR